MRDLISVGTAVQSRRKERGLTVAQASQRCGIARSTFSLIERNRWDLTTLTMASALSHGLVISPYVLPTLAAGGREHRGCVSVPTLLIAHAWRKNSCLGEAIYRERARQQLTLAELSWSCGVSPSYLGAVEAGRRPKIPALVLIADGLGVPRWLVMLLAVRDEEQREALAPDEVFAPVWTVRRESARLVASGRG